MSRFARFKQFNKEERALLEEALISYNREAIDNDDFYDASEKNQMIEDRNRLLKEMEVSNETS